MQGIRLELNFPVYSRIEISSDRWKKEDVLTIASSYAEYYVGGSGGTINIVVTYVDNGYFVGNTIV